MTQRAFLIGILTASGCFGQFYPTGANVNLYFPHLADGGPVYQQWQTSLEFVNPHPTLTAHVSVQLYGDQGFPLSLDLGLGAHTLHSFTVPPLGSVTLRSTIASDKVVTGQAMATSDVPLQGTVLFRSIAYGLASVELSAPATLPTSRYLSPATGDLGVALANISGSSKFFQVTAVDASGTTVSTAMVGVAGLGHTSFNLSEKLPSISSDFRGSVVITPQIPGDQVLAWTVNSNGSVLATLPSGPLEWPISHPDRIMLVFKRLLGAAPALLVGLHNNLSLQNPPTLSISSDPSINTSADAASDTVQISLALSELMSDSPSELAFLVAHELAHIAQYRSGSLTVLLPNDLANKEADADLMAMILVLSAGFDPYGAAGAMGKLNVANGSSGLVSSTFDKLSDPSTAFSTARMNSMLGVITQACSYTTLSSIGYCAPYKTAIHPHFPGSAPL